MYLQIATIFGKDNTCLNHLSREKLTEDRAFQVKESKGSGWGIPRCEESCLLCGIQGIKDNLTAISMVQILVFTLSKLNASRSSTKKKYDI